MKSTKQPMLTTNITYRNTGQTRTLTDVIAVVPGWAISARSSYWIRTVTVLTWITTLTPNTVRPSSTWLALGTTSTGWIPCWAIDACSWVSYVDTVVFFAWTVLANIAILTGFTSSIAKSTCFARLTFSTTSFRWPPSWTIYACCWICRSICWNTIYNYFALTISSILTFFPNSFLSSSSYTTFFFN